MRKIAIVGAGIFGITSAIELAKRGHTVDLYEKERDILSAASGINQYRLHRGYHYPRSPETIVSSRDSEKSFETEYKQAVLRNATHYYCIAKEGSLTSAETFIKTCKYYDLEFKIVNPSFINKNKIELCLKVKESSIDPIKLKAICLKKLKKSKVNIFLNTVATTEILKKYDLKILCAYANLNTLIDDKSLQENYQFELCEKPIIKLPPAMRNKSVVIMDGPFTCFDPYGKTGLLIMGHVVHAIHQSNIGKQPLIDDKFKSLLNNGVIQNPPITNFDLFKESSKQFIPILDKAEHVGSMFTIRTVLPHYDDTDKRPTIVKKIDNSTIVVFSGKIGNCVKAAEEVGDLVKEDFQAL